MVYVWMKDILALIAILLGTFADLLNTMIFNVIVVGTGVTEYQYDLFVSGVVDCSMATYGSWTVVVMLIIDVLGGDDDYCLCVIGCDAVLNVQSTAIAYAWIKDIVVPIVTLSGMPADPSNDTTLNVIVVGTGVTEY